MNEPQIRNRIRTQIRLLTAGLAVTTLITAGCATPSSAPGELAENKQLATTCPETGTLASLVEIDGTGSSRSSAITEERLVAVESIVRRTAACSGNLRIVVFSSSSAATSVLFEDKLHLDGATENARLKRAPELVTAVMSTVRNRFEPAVAELPQNGSDVTAQYRLGAEWTRQLGGESRLELTLFTDGFQNVGIDLGARAFRKHEAEQLADQITMPELSGASVTVAGLGRLAEGAPASTVVEGLVAFYDRLCHRSLAARCLSVMDYAVVAR